MNQVQCSISTQANQFLLANCTNEEEAFLNDFINIIRKEIETGQLPASHFDTLDWNEVLAKARQVKVNSDGSIEITEDGQTSKELGIAGSEYYSEANPFVNPPQVSKAGSFLDNEVNIPGFVWLIAIVVAIGFACQQRGFGKTVKNQIPKIKETALKCYEIIKDNLLKVMP